MIGYMQQIAASMTEKPKPHVIQSSLFFQNENFGISGLDFDLLIDESHSIEFDIADHAVENGSTISDHVTERLRSVQVTGMFTNHPVNKGENFYVGEDGKTIEDEPDEINIEGIGEATINVSRDQKLEKLKELARRRNPVRLVTSMEVYEQMVIESISFDRGPDDGEAVKFTMKLREVRTARTQSVQVDGVWNPPEPPKQETAPQRKMSKNRKKGKVSAVEKASEKLYKKGLNPQVIGG